MARLPPETAILIVDDSPAIRTVVESYLQRLGYTNVRTASSVESGLDVFREQGSQVVFLDLVIGEERGPVFAAAALAEAPFTSIIIMTALSSSHDLVTAAIAEGAQEFLGKPIKPAALAAVLDRIAEMRTDEEDKPQDTRSYV